MGGGREECGSRSAIQIRKPSLFLETVSNTEDCDSALGDALLVLADAVVRAEVGGLRQAHIQGQRRLVRAAGLLQGHAVLSPGENKRFCFTR